MKNIIAVSLLCGWALISAPGTNYDAPVRAWTMTRAHDTALECENDKGNLYSWALKVNNQKWLEKFVEGGWRCIPMDWIAPDKKL